MAMLDDDSAPARTARHLFQRAFQLQRQGDLADAIRLYRESLAHFPSAEAHTFLGWTYAMLRRYPAAIEECQAAIALDPNYGNPYNDIGAYLIELERWAAAIPWLEKAIAAPRYENREFAHFNLGRVFEHLGNWPRAIQSYRSAMAANRNHEPARQALRLLIGKLN
jgi:Tfp pilus assembly protein PilF